MSPWNEYICLLTGPVDPAFTSVTFTLLPRQPNAHLLIHVKQINVTASRSCWTSSSLEGRYFYRYSGLKRRFMFAASLVCLSSGKTQVMGEIKIALKKEMKTEGEHLVLEILQCRNITFKFKSPDHLPGNEKHLCTWWETNIHAWMSTTPLRTTTS